MPNYPPSPVATPYTPPLGMSGGTPPQNDPYSPIFNAFNTAVLNPINTNINNQVSNLQSMGTLQDVGFGQQQGYLNTSLSQGLQGIGLSQQELGVQQSALGRQTGPGGLSQQYENLTQQLLGLSEQDIQSQRQQTQFQSQQQQRGAWSGATSRGATNTSGFGQQLSDIGSELAFKLGGIDREESRLKVAEKQESLRFGEQQAQLSDQQKILGIQAQRLNLSKDQLTSRINNALQQLGLQRSLNPLQIAQAIDDLQNGKYNALSNVLGQIGQIDPGLLQGGASYKGAAGINSALQQAGQQPLTDAEAWIIQHESGFDTGSKNSSSGAFGLGQLNPSSGTLQSIASELGFNPYTTDPVQQVQMFRQYVRGRYGSAENAQTFWQAHNWY